MRSNAITMLLVLVLTPSMTLGLQEPDSSLAAANKAFALELYRHLSQTPGNLCFSPYSVYSALAMAYAGARGETAAEMEAVLHFGLVPDELHAAMGRLAQGLSAVHAESGYELAVANALWGQRGYRFKAAFLRLLESSYEAPLREVDFEQPEEARRLINDWVEERTREKIRDLIPRGAVDRNMRLVLANARLWIQLGRAD